MRRFTILASASTALLAAAAFTGTTVTHEPPDDEHQACIAQAVATVGADPVACQQRVVIEGHCDDVPMPALVPVTYVDIDTKPAIYSDPANNAPYKGFRLLPDGTAEFTFTDVGSLEHRQCPDGISYELVAHEPAMTPAPFRQCWARGIRQTVVQACP
jgi:hypothetical protein